MKDYSGPANLQRAVGFDIHHRCVSIRTGAIRHHLGGFGLGPEHCRDDQFRPCDVGGEFAYSGMALQDIKDGKIATMQVERARFTVNTQQAGKSDKMTGEIANLASRDFDAAALAAILDPQKANDDRYHRVYGKTTAGPYTAHFGAGHRMRIDAMTVDDVGVRPSRLQLPALLATIQAAGAAAAFAHAGA